MFNGSVASYCSHWFVDSVSILEDPSTALSLAELLLVQVTLIVFRICVNIITVIDILNLTVDLGQDTEVAPNEPGSSSEQVNE